jgi:hypothetical protein
MKLHLEKKNTSPYRFPLALLLSFVILGAAPVWAIVVTSTADSGAVSLREAITTANSDGVPTKITFDPAVFPPPPALPGTITFLSRLLT